MISRGLVVGGVVVPGTSDVLRTERAWWQDGHRSTRDRRGARVECYVQHWTGGHITHEESAGPSTYRAMLARKRPDGSPLDVAVNFVIGWGGSIWQVADVLTACVHVGDRVVIRRSVSTEHRWPGTRRWAERIGYREGPWRAVHITGGGLVEIMEPSRELLEASAHLAEMLAAIDHPRVSIPRIVPTTNRRMELAEVRRRTGAIEHGQVPSTKNKIDCVGVLNNHLARAGWARE